MAQNTTPAQQQVASAQQQQQQQQQQQGHVSDAGLEKLISAPPQLHWAGCI